MKSIRCSYWPAVIDVPWLACLYLLITAMNCAKAVSPIEMWFGMSTRIGHENHVLHGGMDPPKGRGSLRLSLLPHSRVQR